MIIEKYERTIYELKQLLEVTKVLNSTLHFKKLVDSILFTFMAQARCVKAALYIGKEIDPEFITLQRNYMGFDITPNIPVKFNCNSPIMTKMAQTRECLSYLDFHKYMDYVPSDLHDDVKEQVELVVPLVINEKLVGIVFLGGRIDSEEITKDEKDFLAQIGIYASIAVQNSILFDMATMDMMTELKVRHYIVKFIDECIKIGDHQFVIFMMDIDDFKSVNDTYGHQTGDDTIKGVANVIKNAIRSHDVASRFGGEEFVVMLRETDLEDALHVAERIRMGVENMVIKHKDSEVKITISIGVAEFDNDIDKTPVDVISRADNSLYKSKKNGKNRITTA
ncbi:MAG: sensor domain-containing diguanylate cyclase [Spirochaetales bacterium]|nr:sensor domain-containing diguanylate cyclase [Spirochaetales bacterium]